MKVPPSATPTAYRARRAAWIAAGRCADCGGARSGPWKRCQWCRIGLSNRVDRSRFRKREGLR